MDLHPGGDGKRLGWSSGRVLLYFLLGLVALDGVIAAYRPVWHAYDPDDYAVRLRGCRRQEHDLVIVGGSPVSEGIDPAVLSGVRWRGGSLDRVYSMGLPGATTSEVWHAVEHGLRTPPRLLMYGVTASDLNDGRDEPHGAYSLMDVGDVARWVRYRPRAAEWCIRQFVQGRFARVWNLFYYRNAIRLWAADQIERLRPGCCPEAAAEAREGLAYSAALRRGHGFAPRPSFQAARLDQVPWAGALGANFHFLDKYHVGGHLAYLRHLLDWAADHGVTVVLVDMPVSAELEERLHPQDFACYHAALAEVERTRGVWVLRANRAAVGLSDADFADLIHLNRSGTARLSAWLRKELAAAGAETRVAAR